VFVQQPQTDERIKGPRPLALRDLILLPALARPSCVLCDNFRRRHEADHDPMKNFLSLLPRTLNRVLWYAKVLLSLDTPLVDPNPEAADAPTPIFARISASVREGGPVFDPRPAAATVLRVLGIALSCAGRWCRNGR